MVSVWSLLDTQSFLACRIMVSEIGPNTDSFILKLLSPWADPQKVKGLRASYGIDSRVISCQSNIDIVDAMKQSTAGLRYNSSRDDAPSGLGITECAWRSILAPKYFRLTRTQWLHDRGSALEGCRFKVFSMPL